jgi:hypothetical protein
LLDWALTLALIVGSAAFIVGPVWLSYIEALSDTDCFAEMQRFLLEFTVEAACSDRSVIFWVYVHRKGVK